MISVLITLIIIIIIIIIGARGNLGRWVYSIKNF